MNDTPNKTFWILEETAAKTWWVFKLDQRYTNGITTAHTDNFEFAYWSAVKKPHIALWQSHRIEDARKLWNDIHLRGGKLVVKLYRTEA